MLTIFASQKDRPKISVMIHDFTLYRLAQRHSFDAIEAMREMKLDWGISIDWHEFANEFDRMRETGILEVSKPGGYVRYRVREQHWT